MEHRRRLILVIILAEVVAFAFMYVVMHHKEEGVNYSIGECRPGHTKAIAGKYYASDGRFVATVITNCCTDIEVKKEGTSYVIYEVRKGPLCKCMCSVDVTIYNVTMGDEIVFRDFLGRNFIVNPNVDFCGWSTYGKCSTDADCVTDGCSGQVCRSVNDKPVVTTCEFLPCYNSRAYGVSCKCVSNMCQWST